MPDAIARMTDAVALTLAGAFFTWEGPEGSCGTVGYGFSCFGRPAVNELPV